jgi:hypothetical protein
VPFIGDLVIAVRCGHSIASTLVPLWEAGDFTLGRLSLMVLFRTRSWLFEVLVRL